VYIGDEFKKFQNATKAAEAVSALKVLINPKNRTEDNIIKAFKSVGIKLSGRTISDILNGKYEYNGSRLTTTQFFNSSYKKSPLKYILDSLKIIVDSETPIEVGEESTDLMTHGTVKALASLESKYSRHLYPNSFNSGSKTIFSYTNDKFIVDRMYELLRAYKTGDKSKSTLLDKLNQDIFAKNSYWLSRLTEAIDPDSDSYDSNFAENFEFGYLSLDPLKKSKDNKSEVTDRSIVDLSPKEIIAIKLAHLLNSASKSKNDLGIEERVGKLFYPTTSDKSNIITIQSLLYGGTRYDSETKSIDDNTVRFVFDNVVLSELNRMWEVQKATNNYEISTNIDSYDDGAKYFYAFPALNGLKGLFDFETKPGTRLLKDLEAIDEKTKELVFDTIKLSLNAMIVSQIEEFKENGIGYVVDEKGKESIKFIDSKGVDMISANYINPTLKQKSDAVAADFAIEYFIHNANVSQLFHGDYAQYFKGKVKKSGTIWNQYEQAIQEGNISDLGFLHELVKPTFDNLGKRLAADIAPGYEADYKGKTQLRVTTSIDRDTKSRSDKFIKEVFNANSSSQTEYEKNAYNS